MTTATPPDRPIRVEYHVMTNHGFWAFLKVEDALLKASVELKSGESVHIYPMEVTRL